jgi:hypothetical protein
MTDRELLELAAKAAGIEIAWHKWVIDPKATGGCCFALVGTYTYWNPLTDDGDALRLAVKLGLTITSNYHVEQKGLGVIVFTELEDSEDFCAATRRAIVRAAAEIGRGMK